MKDINRHNKPKTNSIYLILLSFIIPSVILSLVYASIGIFPFGSKSIFVSDLAAIGDIYGSVTNFFGKNTSILYSWSKAMGGNNMGSYAFYLSSPFSFITFFFPKNQLSLSLTIMTILKIGSAGLAFSLFLKYTFKKRDLSIVAFSVFYALMSYGIVYSMCLMWIDGLIWLPLVILGIERVIRESKPTVLIISLMAIFISSYYISYMIGLFSAIFFIYRYFSEYSKQGVTEFIKKFYIFIISVIASVCLSAWLLIPTFVTLGEGKLGSFNYIFNLDHNFDFINVFSKLFVGTYDTITQNGLPNIFCGMIILSLVIGYFFVKSIGLIEKFFTLLFIGLFLISFYIKSIDVIWHAFQMPNWFPYRYSFIFSFFLLFIAFKAFNKIKEIPIAIFISFFFAFTGISIYIYKSKFVFLTDQTIYTSLILLAVYTTVLCFLKYKSESKGRIFIIAILLFVSIFEMNMSTFSYVNGINKQYPYPENSSYTELTNNMMPLVDKANSLETSFFRMDKTFNDEQKNLSLNYGYNGFTLYNALYNKNLNSFLKGLGFAQGWFWSSYYGSTIITDSLFDVKYVLSEKKVNDSYTTVGEKANISLFKNPYTLSIAFMGNVSLLDSNVDSPDSLENQKNLLQAFNDQNESYFNKIDDVEIIKDNLRSEEQGGYIKYTPKNEGLGTLTYKFKVKKNNQIYASFPTNTADPVDLYINDKHLGTYLKTNEDIHSIYIGSFDKDQTVTLRLELSNNKLELINQYIYSLDMDKFTKCIDSIKEHELKITDYNSTKVVGNIDVADKTLMFTSIPYDKGWTVLVDGKETVTLKYANTLMCVTLTPGKHSIEMTYSPEGFLLGISISLSTLCLLILISILAYLRRKKTLLITSRMKKTVAISPKVF